MATEYESGIEYGERIQWNYVTLLIIGFSLLYLIAAFYFSLAEESRKYTVGPGSPTVLVEIKKENQSVGIELSKPYLDNYWSYIEVEIVDDQNKVAGSFGMNFYHESGYDSDGGWQESRLQAKTHYVFQNKGKYRLRFKEQKASTYRKVSGFSPIQSLKVEISTYRGSDIPFMIWGVILLVVGIIVNEIRNWTLCRVFGALFD
ncbi:hypothetical protein RYZ26_09940 [Terasakiella sp. A23]|uniref:hypothetical protein n=1 Tax=Terasakiella sp. FCG-A23 TaxID=3080561 RepID=UPI002952A550|nr:hypothetical protein [Terasakiella sp. A23]MDV7339915.1 hypothetical protein [Terasakiella sp. A23]